VIPHPELPERQSRIHRCLRVRALARLCAEADDEPNEVVTIVSTRASTASKDIGVSVSGKSSGDCNPHPDRG